MQHYAEGVCFDMVPRPRVELGRLAARDFESRASTDSAIGARYGCFHQY